MGRRSRKRQDAPASAGGRAPARRRPASPAPPQAPWHPVPLVELSVLAGIVLLVAGFLNFEDRDGRLMLVAGMALASLAGADTAAREHFGGVRSHSLLLAAIPGVLAAGASFFARAPWPVLVVVAAAAFGAAFLALRNAFRRRSGGLSFKIR